MEWKYATVFISSSFIDMHAERDYLIKKVFPELEEWCEKHKIHLSNIDLRWGVPEDVSKNNSTIEKCLSNIDESRPFFLCFLAQRRGWIPGFKNYISQNVNLDDVDEISFDYSTGNKGHLKVFIGEDEIFDEEIVNEGDSLKWNHAVLDVSSYNGSLNLKFENFFESESNFSDSINLLNLACSSNSKEINTSDVISNPTFKDYYRYWKTSGSLDMDKEENFLILKGSDISKNTADRYEDIAQFEKRSATEMEIEHALLRPLRVFMERDKEKDPKEYNPAAHSLFFIRDKSSLNGISDAQKRVYTNYELVDVEKGEFVPGVYDEKGNCIKKAKIIDDLSEETKTIIKETDDASQEIIDEIIKRKSDEDLKGHIEINLAEHIREHEEPSQEIIEEIINSKKDDETTKDSVQIEITKYVGDWNETLKIPEIEAIERFNDEEWMGRLTNFKEIKEDYKDINLLEESADINSKIGRPLKDVIIEQLKEQLIWEFPENFVDVPVSPDEKILQDELNQQDNFAYINTQGYIEREDDVDKLTRYIEDSDENRICLVSSEAGYGKTMLLANFATMLEKKYTDKHGGNENQKYIFKRFCGASDLSSRVFPLWDSIIQESGIKEDEDFTFPSNVDELKKSIPTVLKKIAEKGESVIIIDAVNQMPDGIEMLRWLPAPESSNLKIIISCKEDRKDDDYDKKLGIIKDRNAFCDYFDESKGKNLGKDYKNYSFELKAWESDEQKTKIIESYLRNYLKELSPGDIETICRFDASKNPLFLKILLAELRVFASFEKLKDEIQEFIKDEFGDTKDGETNTGSPKTAFNHVLERLEKDEDLTDDKPLVPLIFSLLANARTGLSKDELTSIIKAQTGLDEEVIRDTVNVNLRQVKPFMARKEGRDDFFYESFKLAAQQRYSKDFIQKNERLSEYFSDKKDPNELISDYFLKEALGDGSAEDYHFEGEDVRPYNELPYHLTESKDFDRLGKTLSSYSFIKNKIDLSDINNLIMDYQFKDFEDDTEHEFIHTKGDEDHSVVLIGRALELSAPVVSDKKDQLATQLFGRMVDLKDDEIIKPLLDEVEEDLSSNYHLKPKSSSLYSPKSSIIKRPKVNGTKSTSAIEITPDKLLILANADGTLNLFDLENNNLEILEDSDARESSKIVKIIPTDDDKNMIIASSNGEINKWDINNRSIFKGEDNKYPKIDAEITDIYLSKTYNKIYASSHTGIFSIDLETKELKEEDVEHKEYNQILVPRRNEAILVCDEKEVDGWDVYEMRKAYNRHHQQNDDNDEDASRKMDSSEEIRFMGLNKRFLTLISENGQMKFWNTLKNSGGGESIDETRVCGLNDKFKQALTLEDENRIITISEMGVLRVYEIPQPRSPKFNREINEKTGMKMDIQTGIKSPTAIDYYNDGNDRWVIVGNENNDVSIIDLNKKVEDNAENRHSESVLTIKLDGNHMITASESGEVFTWDADGEECINKFANDFRCNSISFNANESKLVLAGVKVDEKGNKINKIATCDVNDGMWEAIETPKGEDGKEKLIELEVHEDKSGMGEVIEITQNSSGLVFIEENKLTIGSDDFELKETATVVDASLDSADAFVGFEDGSIVKYPSQNAFETKVACPVTKIKILGERLIAGYKDGSVNIFDLNGNCLTSLEGHDKAINNIYVDDSKIITVSKDNTLKIWENDECIYTYFLDIYATSVNIKGDKLIVGDTLGNVRFFTFEN